MNAKIEPHIFFRKKVTISDAIVIQITVTGC